MGRFKLVCCKCGSDNILEKSGVRRLVQGQEGCVHGEGIERLCTECNNEDFFITKTWVKNDPKEV